MQRKFVDSVVQAYAFTVRVLLIRIYGVIKKANFERLFISALSSLLTVSHALAYKYCAYKI